MRKLLLGLLTFALTVSADWSQIRDSQSRSEWPSDRLSVRSVEAGGRIVRPPRTSPNLGGLRRTLGRERTAVETLRRVLPQSAAEVRQSSGRDKVGNILRQLRQTGVEIKAEELREVFRGSVGFPSTRERLTRSRSLRRDVEGSIQGSVPWNRTELGRRLGEWLRQLDRETVLIEQKMLRDHGWYTGRLDGISGPQTQAAIRRFQEDRGLPITGRFDPVTETALTFEQVKKEEEPLGPLSALLELERSEQGYRILLPRAEGYEQVRVGTYQDATDLLAGALRSGGPRGHVHVSLRGFNRDEFDAFVSTWTVHQSQRPREGNTTFRRTARVEDDLRKLRFDFERIDPEKIRTEMEAGERFKVEYPFPAEQGAPAATVQLSIRAAQELTGVQQKRIVGRILAALVRFFREILGAPPTIGQIGAADLRSLIRQELKALKNEGIPIHDPDAFELKFREELSDVYFGRNEDRELNRRVAVLDRRRSG